MRLAALLLLLATISAPADSIDNLLSELSKQPEWLNGKCPTINLPASTPHEEIVRECLLHWQRIDKEVVDKFKIITMRRVEPFGTPTEGDYFAALVDTDTFQKIVLFTYLQSSDKKRGNWWTRIYSAN